MTKKMSTLVQKLTPTNMEAEKRKWLFDHEYNPQFEYEESFSEEDLDHYGEASDEYLGVARGILSKVMKTWGDDTTYLSETEGTELSRAEVDKQIREYLLLQGLENQVLVTYSSKVVARTSVKGNNLIIRLPVKYRSGNFPGVLEHEVGVHILRRLNDDQQPWKGKRKQYELDSYLTTEEGLAVLHANAVRQDKHLWFPALSYLAVYLAQRLSFAQLAKELQVYISSPEKVWDACVKAKRGLRDTSMPGGFTKNQVYFTGAIQVMRWLRKNHYDARPLYVGKVALDDLQTGLQHSELTLEELHVPQLILRRDWYKTQLELIARENKLPL